jgi:hypothetical protein
MKKILFIFVIICVVLSCKKESVYDKFPQEWKLVGMYAMDPSTMETGTDMFWQETYLLNNDGTFIKKRESSGTLKEASGTFSIKDFKDDKFLELVFESGENIAGTCTSGVETIWFKSELLMQSTWSSCDGPGLMYERIK